MIFIFYWDMILLFIQCQHISCYGYRKVFGTTNKLFVQYVQLSTEKSLIKYLIPHRK